MLIVEKIGYIVNSIRPKGTVTFTNSTPDITLPCDYVLNCGCNKVEESGTFDFTELTPYYYFGNVYEVKRILDNKNNNQKRKYPCVILEQPFTTKVISNQNESPELTLFIINYSDVNATYVERYKSNFKELLYPLWNKIHKAIKKSDLVSGYELVHIKEHPNFYVNKVISDNWDLLEIKIKILFNHCEKDFCENLIYN